MIRIPIIRRALAGLMLLLFAFSNTPRKTLHDFFAHHKDVPVRYTSSTSDQFSPSGFNCRCEDLVAESPFLGVSSLPKLEPPAPCWSRAYPAMKEDFVPMPSRYFGLRGPPVV